jgi:hypothetical protein
MGTSYRGKVLAGTRGGISTGYVIGWEVYGGAIVMVVLYVGCSCLLEGGMVTG